MIPFIIGALGLIAYGLSEENNKPKAVKKMAKGGGVGGEQITKVAGAIFSANEKNGKIKISTKASQTLGGLKYLIADLNSEHIASMIFEANEKNGKIKTQMGEKTYGQLLALISHAKANRLDSVNMAKGGNISSEIDALYEKSGFVNDDYNWKSKLLEMLQDNSVEAYQIYQKLTAKEKKDVLQELFEMENDMGADGDGEISTSKDNLSMFLEDSKNGKKYARGGGVKARKSGSIEMDKKYSALKSGSRESEKYAYVDIKGGGTYRRRNANQYGKTKGGNEYREYRNNRTDSTRYYADGGNISGFEAIVKKALKENNKWHFISENVDGKDVQLKMYVSPKEVDVQIFKINGIHHGKMNYQNKTKTLAMIMSELK